MIVSHVHLHPYPSLLIVRISYSSLTASWIPLDIITVTNRTNEDDLDAFNASFNNISVISWQSVLLVEETGVPEENHWPGASHRQTLSHNVVSSTQPWVRFELTTSVVIGTDCTGSGKSNYHMIMIPSCENIVLQGCPRNTHLGMTKLFDGYYLV